MNNTANQLPKRENVPSEHKWKLEDMFKDNQAWERDFSVVKELIKEVGNFKSLLSQNSDTLLEALRLKDRVTELAYKLFVYARMRKDEDNTNTLYQGLADRAQGLMNELGSALSFFNPELLSISEETLTRFIEENEGLILYKHMLDEITRQKSHVLSAQEEQIIAMAGDIASAPSNIYGMINNADIKFPCIKDENGQEVELTKGRYISFLESSDRRVRKDAFHALYSSYKKQKNTLAQTLSSSVKRDIFYSKVRKYSSSLEAALDEDNVTLDVYDNLISTISNNLEPMYKYVALRKRMLGVDELHMYDLYTPIIKDVKMEVPYSKGVELVIDGLKPLGDEYERILREGFKGGWVDVYENEGKTSGAYSWGCYDTHPYVLMNYQDDVSNLFTLAHEMGHALHSYYTNQEQPFVYSGYKIFVAEVASTLNEALLMEYMLNNTQDKKEKMYLINYYLEQFRGTVYRQTMFAEFEKIIHERAEAGEPLTPELLCNIYRDLNRKYYGPDIVIDEDIDMEWSRIPHFYRNFYVYKYATGFSAAASLAESILKEGQPAVKRYIDFLKGGDSDYPVNLLKKAGVDMTTPDPIIKAVKTFERLVEELDGLVD